jgi:hypothetical protein
MVVPAASHIVAQKKPPVVTLKPTKFAGARPIGTRSVSPTGYALNLANAAHDEHDAEFDKY